MGLLLAAMNVHGRAEDAKIRVAIAEGIPRVVISGENLNATEAGHHRFSEKELEITARKNGIEMMGKVFKGPLRVKGDGDAIYVDGRQYRGELAVYGGRDGLLVVDELPLETYLIGLINAEAHSSWPMESLKAQAVAARSYALFRLKSSRTKAFDLRATVADQVYLGSSLEDSAAAQAVESTRGEVVSYNGAVAETFYHSTCGGRTAGVGEVWGGNLPYLKSVECDWCQESPRYFWRYETDFEEIGAALQSDGINVGPVSGIEIVSKTPSGRNDVIKIEGEKGARMIKAAVLRKAIGYTKLFSTLFEVFEPEEGKFLFLGRGSGHGVGMCQWGARGLALDGKSHSEILLYYYPGCAIINAYPD